MFIKSVIEEDVNLKYVFEETKLFALLETEIFK